MGKLALGKGLEALIPSEGKPKTEPQSVRRLPLDQIKANPLQPRREFNEESLRTLAESVKRDGIIQPLVIKKDGSMYTIIAGERRFRAARMAGLTEVPVVVMDDVNEARMLELALVENLQREDLNPIEVAEAYRSLIEQCGQTQQELADHVGKSRAAVANALRLLYLPEPIKQMVRSGQLSEGHARSILALTSEEEMIQLAHRILEESLSVRDAEQVSRKRQKRRPAKCRRIPELMEAENFLKQTLGTAVRIVSGRKKNRIEIEFYNDDDLDRLLELFRRLQ